jgi:hypothetical protein
MEKLAGLSISTGTAKTLKFKSLTIQSLYQDGVYFYGLPVPNPDIFLKINNYNANIIIINGVTNPSNYYTININTTQNNQSISIPYFGTITGTIINWGDGSTPTTSTVTHTYSVPGIYSITVTGTIPLFNFVDPFFSFVISIPSIGIIMTELIQTFYSSPIISVPGLSTCNTINITNMSQLFSGASSFNQPLNWDTSAVTDMSAMFESASSFNKNLNTFNTINVTNMSAMFYGAILFNKNLSFNTINVTDMSNMFTGSQLDVNHAIYFLKNCCYTQVPNIQSGVQLGLSSAVWTYPTGITGSAAAAAAVLTNSYGWIIT